MILWFYVERLSFFHVNPEISATPCRCSSKPGCCMVMEGASFPQQVLHQEVWKALTHRTKPLKRKWRLTHRQAVRHFLRSSLLGFGLQTSALKDSPLHHTWGLTSFTAVNVAPAKAHLCQQTGLLPPLDVSHLHWWRIGAQLLKSVKVPKHQGALDINFN